jgi:hypothetical protein
MFIRKVCVESHNKSVPGEVQQSLLGRFLIKGRLNELTKHYRLQELSNQLRTISSSNRELSKSLYVSKKVNIALK